MFDPSLRLLLATVVLFGASSAMRAQTPPTGMTLLTAGESTNAVGAGCTP